MLEQPWNDVLRAARSLGPADKWRERLAREIQRCTGARFASVCTCPPGNTLEAQGAVSPASRTLVVEQIFAQFLTRIERTRNGLFVAASTEGQAYAPLEKTASRELAAELHEKVLAPAGIHGLVNAFLLGEKRAVLGWITVGTSQPVAQQLAAWGRGLTQVSQEAARTLQGAVDLAAGCGARPPAGDTLLMKLSMRERQVAALVATGLSDGNVAQRLRITEETVGSHLRRIFVKLGVHSRVDLAAKMAPLLQQGFLTAD